MSPIFKDYALILAKKITEKIELIVSNSSFDPDLEIDIEGDDLHGEKLNKIQQTALLGIWLVMWRS